LSSHTPRSLLTVESGADGGGGGGGAGALGAGWAALILGAEIANGVGTSGHLCSALCHSSLFFFAAPPQQRVRACASTPVHICSPPPPACAALAPPWRRWRRWCCWQALEVRKRRTTGWGGERGGAGRDCVFPGRPWQGAPEPLLGPMHPLACVERCTDLRNRRTTGSLCHAPAAEGAPDSLPLCPAAASAARLRPFLSSSLLVTHLSPHIPPPLSLSPCTGSAQAAPASDLPPPRRSAAAVASPPGDAAPSSSAEQADLLWLAHAAKITFERPSKGGVPTTMTMHGVAPL